MEKTEYSTDPDNYYLFKRKKEDPALLKDMIFFSIEKEMDHIKVFKEFEGFFYPD